ncbi:hypothetical protein DL98DRAFT_515988 [Cadophora sp. DSE1049]|nr:hypothetical protein DL98DRAFT_515988 [Cadophora sp. DSE1049]
MEDNKMEEGEAAKGIRDLEGPKVNKEVHNTKEAEEGTEIQYTKSTVATPPPQLPEPLSQPLPNTQRPFEDIWRSLKQLINDTNTEYRAAKEKMPDILPVLRKEQVEVKDEQGPADPRFKGGDLLVDETPRFLYINNPLSIPPRLWASQFTRSCYWMSSSPYEAHIERLQSLYCFGVDEDSPVECRLRDGDQGSWKLCSVLVAPALATQSQADQTLQGGIIYHYGKAGTLGDNGFLAGELRCALTILASQLRSKRQSQLRSQDIDFDFGQHLQKCHVSKTIP